MARTHGLDKRLAEEQHAMTSTQKQPKHHSHSSSTQDSVKGGGGSPKRYDSGANVSKGPKPPAGKGGVGPVSKPKQSGY
jgi:hypothetical protein